MTKNQTPLTRFAWLFYNQTFYRKSERHFLDQVARDGKSVNIQKAASSGWAEIENIKNNAICYVFNFSSATRGRFLNVGTLLSSLATW